MSFEFQGLQTSKKGYKNAALTFICSGLFQHSKKFFFRSKTPSLFVKDFSYSWSRRLAVFQKDESGGGRKGFATAGPVIRPFVPFQAAGEVGAGVHNVPLPAFTPAGRGIVSLSPKAVVCILLSQCGVLHRLVSYLYSFTTSVKIRKLLKFTWGNSDFQQLCF